MDEQIDTIPEIMVSGGLLTIALIILSMHFMHITPASVPWPKIIDPSVSQLALFSSVFIAVSYILGRVFIGFEE